MTDFKKNLPQYYEEENEDGTVDTIRINWPIFARGFQDFFLISILTL